MNHAIEFSLVIPCYNEGAGLPELIRRCRFVAAEGNGEVILVDNGSTDNSSEILEAELGAESRPGPVWWIRIPLNKGYGFGIVSGLNNSRGQFVGWTHADLQADPVDALRAVGIAGQANERRLMLKGKRYGRPVSDKLFTAGMSIFESILMGRVLRDINAQPTMFDRSLIDQWGTPPDDFSLDVFSLYQARRNGFRVIRFPVIFAPRKWGSSHWNTGLRSKWKFIKRTISFSFKMRLSK